MATSFWQQPLAQASIVTCLSVWKAGTSQSPVVRDSETRLLQEDHDQFIDIVPFSVNQAKSGPFASLAMQSLLMTPLLLIVALPLPPK
jgi:hypothetical protein